MTLPLKALVYFNPRPPRGGRRQGIGLHRSEVLFQSTPPARGAPVAIGNRRHLHLGISIHAPREGGDFARELKGQRYIFISIHAPREGGDLGVLGYAANSDLFQSTPPARGATKSIQGCRCFLSDFNPRPPRGGRRDDPAGRLGDVVFQSTPPARGATAKWRLQWVSPPRFQSTPPARGATQAQDKDFPRLVFQSTPPARGATTKFGLWQPMPLFQSTPPARGATMQQPMSQPVQQFQSTPPARGATILGSNSWNFLLFQSTPPARGATLSLCLLNAASLYFNPRPPRGGRHTGG